MGWNRWIFDRKTFRGSTFSHAANICILYIEIQRAGQLGGQLWVSDQRLLCPKEERTTRVLHR